jgi:RHH-type transcriptional regulator, rel operon repressor / antitoxin RelB
MAQSKVLSVRLTPELKAQLDGLAAAPDRPRNWVVNRALEDYAAAQAWQIGQIRRGLAAAEAGDFAEPAEVKAAFGAFRRRRRRAG